MKLEDKIRLQNNVFTVEIGLAEVPESLTPQEKDSISRFGEMEIAVGGNIVEDDPEITFTLPVENRLFPSQFPIKKQFSRDDHADANDRAVAYRNIIKTRIVAARDAHLELSPGVIGTNITEV